jgi:hypothetical protein
MSQDFDLDLCRTPSQSDVDDDTIAMKTVEESTCNSKRPSTEYTNFCDPPVAVIARPRRGTRKAPTEGNIALWDKYEGVAEHLQHQLMTLKDCVVDATVVQTARGWLVTAYVKPNKFKSQADCLQKVAQHAVLDAVTKAEIVYILGCNVQAFATVPSGFGCTLVEMPDLDSACWDSYSNGFCCSPASCKLLHPRMTDRATVNFALKPARGK